ncbi:glycosyltransferase family 4 protein [Pseudoduganella violaceinigra]|uniref:glycosyltransferase family 4 protein n=1 Tax=Pseudoduganella violaceinigra TaxID=246602 RepID=UPI000411C5E2|nr:glycosyltransferase family 4 protein [Pseudoduganella violaceinigra]
MNASQPAFAAAAHALSGPEVQRIALVGPLPPPSGGMANQALQLAGLLREAGIAVDFVQTNAPYRPAWAGRLRGVRALFRMVPYLGALWRAAGRVQVFHVMANSGWSWHLFAAPAIWIAHLRGTPVVVNYRGGEAANFLKQAAAWMRPSLRRCAALAVPSGFLAHVFGQHGIDAVIVPNIVNLERFAATAAPRALGGLRLLVARNLEDIYDNASALRAFALVRAAHPAARLTVAGSGPLRSALEQLARELGVADAVHFTGRVETADMPALYRNADIMLNPSLVDNMPNSVLEALASGALVVSTDVGGVPYVVEHGRTALLVPPADPAAMAQAVLRLADEPGLAEALRSAGRASVAQYAWASVKPCLLDVYRQALASKGGRRP